jgi:glycosyltransferase involved in cell wall biosynthesis
MKFSILMPNYNKAEFLAEAINSVLAQSYNYWELLILDDCSGDDSVVVIKKLLGDKRIQFFMNKKNIGKTRSLKKLVGEAKGEIIVELDSDDALSPEALSLVSMTYDKNPGCGLVYSQCYYCDHKLQPIHKGLSAAIPKGKSNLHVNSVVALRTYRKSAYQMTTGYDEAVKFAEDIDLVLKLEEITRLYFINEPLYFYRILRKSQTHSFLNTRINRSSTALAKLNAYKRRLGTGIPNLERPEIAEVLFWGSLNAVLAGRLSLAFRFVFSLLKIHPFFIFDYLFYRALLGKIIKIKKLKKEKPLLSV